MAKEHGALLERSTGGVGGGGGCAAAQRARTHCPPRPPPATTLLCLLQEDAHIALHMSDDCHIFAVFDGHGGPEVARFCSRRMPVELKVQPAFQEGRYEESLKQVGLPIPGEGRRAVHPTAGAATAAGGRAGCRAGPLGLDRSIRGGPGFPNWPALVSLLQVFHRMDELMRSQEGFAEL